ncbi:hypothetical protein Bca101_011204 [Brassica carinata]
MSPPKPLSDMVETRRSSSASKRFCGGGTGGVFLGERGPVENRRSESVETELGSSDPQAMDAEKPMGHALFAVMCLRYDLRIEEKEVQLIPESGWMGMHTFLNDLRARAGADVQSPNAIL